MRFLEVTASVSAYLSEHRRVSLRGLRRGFDLDDDTLAELIDELVDVQRVANREGDVLVWAGGDPYGGAEGDGKTTEARPEESPALVSVGSPRVSDSEAERRQLTVLFCDLVDSTKLASGMDPEDWRNVVQVYQEAAASAVEMYDGHVAQYLGDGLLAYFGYPHAHEDEGERAVRAGLGILGALAERNPALQERHGVRVSARVGIHTGSVVVGAMGAGAHAETLALGETTNLAARVQAVAAPDTVAITADTLSLVRGVFVTEDLGTPPMKGVERPVSIRRVVQPSGVRSRLVTGRLTAFVGREQEISLVAERWEQVLEGEGQAVSITGEAGIGKSRTALAWKERLADEHYTWLECRASPYTQNTPFAPVLELVEQGLAFAQGDSPEVKLDKLEARLREAGLGSGERVALLGDLLGIPLDGRVPPLELSPPVRREQTLEALVAWTLALGRIQPLVLLFEDLHWADASSLELFERLLEEIPTTHALVLLTSRPEFEAPWKHPKNLTPIVLQRLGRRRARDFVERLDREQRLPEPAVAELIERAGGVPLFLEELTRAALESEGAGAEVTIPRTLQDSLMARLDRLSEAKKRAQLVSALGREFPYRLAASVSGADEGALAHDLERLVEEDILHRRGSPPDATYTFKHALIQDAAYESLLRAHRQALHRRIVDALERDFPDRVAAEPEVAAQHCEAAGLTDAAIGHFSRAAELAAGRSAHHEAIGHLRRAVDLVGTLAASPGRDGLELRIQLAFGASCMMARGWSSPDAEAAYQRASSLCDSVSDPKALAFTLWGLFAFHQTRGDLDEAMSLGERLRAQSPSGGDRFLFELAGCQSIGSTQYFQGRFASAREHLEMSLTADDPARVAELSAGFGMDLGLVARCYLTWTFWALGLVDRAVELAKATETRARSTDLASSIMGAIWGQAMLHGWRREPEASGTFAQALVSSAGELGFPVYAGCGRILLGWSHAGQATAQTEVEAGLATLEGVGFRMFAPLSWGILADVRHRVGRHAEALASIDTGLAIAEETGQRFWDAELHRLRGEALLAGEGPGKDHAERSLRRALEVARSQSALAHELRASTSLARCWQQQGRRVEARELLEPVCKSFPEGAGTPDLRDANALLETLKIRAESSAKR